MRKLWIPGILTIAILAIWAAVPAQEAEAFNCHECGPPKTTLPAWGMGSSCFEAENNAIALAESQIPCDTCQTPMAIEVTACHLCGDDPNDPEPCTAANQYRADFKVRYRCDVDMCM